MIGELRRKRSWLTQNWSNSARSAVCARATYSGKVKSLFRRRLKRIAGSDDSLGFNLDQVALAHQPGLDQGVRRADRAEALTMHARDGFPVGEIADIHARAHDIAQGAAKLADGSLDLVQNEARLRGRVARADDPVRPGR